MTFGSPDCLPHHLADPLALGRPLLLWRTLRAWQRTDPTQRSLLFWFANYSLRTAARHRVRAYLNAPDSSGRLPTWLDREFVRSHSVRSRARAPEIPRHPAPGRHALWQEAYAQAAAIGVGSETDPGVEFRHPLLDRDLLEFMLNIPYQLRQAPGSDRRLQRRALAGILPDPIVERRSKGSGQRTFDLGLRSSASGSRCCPTNRASSRRGSWTGHAGRRRCSGPASACTSRFATSSWQPASKSGYVSANAGCQDPSGSRWDDNCSNADIGA